jgi:hypothetical protein
LLTCDPIDHSLQENQLVILPGLLKTVRHPMETRCLQLGRVASPIAKQARASPAACRVIKHCLRHLILIERASILGFSSAGRRLRRSQFNERSDVESIAGLRKAQCFSGVCNQSIVGPDSFKRAEQFGVSSLRLKADILRKPIAPCPRVLKIALLVALVAEFLLSIHFSDTTLVNLFCSLV